MQKIQKNKKIEKNKKKEEKKGKGSHWANPGRISPAN
jgi:hypothetical protein